MMLHSSTSLNGLRKKHLTAAEHQQPVRDRFDKGTREAGILGSSRSFYPTVVVPSPSVNYLHTC